MSRRTGSKTASPGDVRSSPRRSKADSPFRTICLLVLTCTLALGPASVGGSTQETTGEIPLEYQIKAAFLYNYIKFTKWPESTFKNEKNPYVIGVLGSNPFGSYLEKLVLKKTVKNRPIEIRCFKDQEGLRSCHVLFISSSEYLKLPKFLKSLAGSDVLTVSDMTNFIARGGMIHLFVKEKKVKFAVNFKAIETQRFKISSKLLKLADNPKEKE